MWACSSARHCSKSLNVAASWFIPFCYLTLVLWLTALLSALHMTNCSTQRHHGKCGHHCLPPRSLLRFLQGPPSLSPSPRWSPDPDVNTEVYWMPTSMPLPLSVPLFLKYKELLLLLLTFCGGAKVSFLHVNRRLFSFIGNRFLKLLCSIKITISNYVNVLIALLKLIPLFSKLNLAKWPFLLKIMAVRWLLKG